MKLRIPLIAFLVLTGCAGPVVRESKPVVAAPAAGAGPAQAPGGAVTPAAAVGAGEPAVLGATAMPGAATATAASVPEAPPHPAPAVAGGPVAGEQLIEISSDPTGARIFVNNQPMGRAPLRLAVKVTAQGFCADYLTVKARFVAEDLAHLSQTVDVQFSPLEKAPAKIVFTPEGAQRRMQ